MSDVGTGTTIVFATSAFTADVLSINGNDISRPSIDVTKMASSAYREFIPGKLVDGGSIEVEALFDPDNQPPVDQAAETITITFPIPAGGLTGATFVFVGYVETWSWADPLEDRMTATMTIKVAGTGTAPAWTAST